MCPLLLATAGYQHVALLLATAGYQNVALLLATEDFQNMALLFFVERHCCRQVHFVHLTDGHRRKGDVPDGVVCALDTGYGRRGAVLHPHLVDQHDGACQAESTHHGPQRPVENLSV